MNDTVLVVFLLIVASWGVGGLFYALVVRPVLADRARFRLFSLRDDLRFMAARGEIRADDRNYEFLERFLCRSVDYCRWFTYTHFLEFLWCHSSDLSRDVAIFDEQAGEGLRKLRNDAVEQLYGIVIINSPVMSLCFALLDRGAGFLEGLFAADGAIRSRVLGKTASTLHAIKGWIREKKVQMALFFQEQPDCDYSGGQPVLE